jgi:aspartate aminotransferase
MRDVGGGPRISATIGRVAELAVPLLQFFNEVETQAAAARGTICDFVAGNPQEMALDDYVEALQRWSRPEAADWFAYKTSEPEAQAAAAKSLRERLGVPYEPEDIAMTNAAIAALAVCFRVLADPGDEILIIQPPHFLYEPLMVAVGAKAVRVPVRTDDFDLDVDAIDAAITERTRAVLVNTPHNPTGKIFPRDTLERLAAVLVDASERHGDPIYLISDEAYNRLLFDGREFVSPAAVYPNTLLVYSYGKQLLAPGQRIGYIAVSPDMPGREQMRMALAGGQFATGYAFPNALLQHALGDLEPLSIDVEHLQEKRDRMVAELRRFGYELHVPEATFYLLPKSPLADDVEFCRRMAARGVLLMPGTLMEVPGRFRISLTATDEMIDRSLPIFEEARSWGSP